MNVSQKALSIIASKTKALPGEGIHFQTSDPIHVRKRAYYEWDFGESYGYPLTTGKVSKDARYSQRIYPGMVYRRQGKKTIRVTRYLDNTVASANLTVEITSPDAAYPGDRTAVFASSPTNHRDGAPAGAKTFTNFISAVDYARQRSGRLLIHRSETIVYGSTYNIDNVYIAPYGSGTRRPKFVPNLKAAPSSLFGISHRATERTVVWGINSETGYNPINPAKVPDPRAKIDFVKMNSMAENVTIFGSRLIGHHALTIDSGTNSDGSTRGGKEVFIVGNEIRNWSNYGLFVGHIEHGAIRGNLIELPAGTKNAGGTANRDINGAETTVNAPSHGPLRVQICKRSSISQNQLRSAGGWTFEKNVEVHQPALRFMITFSRENDGDVGEMHIAGGHDMVTLFPTSFGTAIPYLPAKLVRLENIYMETLGMSVGGIATVYDGTLIENIRFLIRPHREGKKQFRLFGHGSDPKMGKPGNITDPVIVGGVTVDFEGDATGYKLELFKTDETFTSVPAKEGIYGLKVNAPGAVNEATGRASFPDKGPYQGRPKIATRSI